MFVYFILCLVFVTIVLSLVMHFIHLSQYKFKKYLKLFIFISFISILIILIRFNHKVIELAHAAFVLFFKWMPVFRFLKNTFFKNLKKKDHDEALEILGLNRNASRKDILERYNKLMKKNHPDVGGSEWITKKIKKARDILLG